MLVDMTVERTFARLQTELTILSEPKSTSESFVSNSYDGTRGGGQTISNTFSNCIEYLYLLWYYLVEAQFPNDVTFISRVDAKIPGEI